MEFFNGTAPAYADKTFHPADQSRITRRSKFRLNIAFCNSSTGQKCLSYQGPKIWNSLASDLKSTNNVNTFKHKIKEYFFKYIQRKEDECVMMHIDDVYVNTSHTLLLPIWFKLKVLQHLLEFFFSSIKVFLSLSESVAVWLRRLTRKPKVRTAVGSNPALDSLVAVRNSSPGQPVPCEGNLVAAAD